MRSELIDKTILISGAAGFIGSHICDYYLQSDANVIAMDNLITSNGKNIEHLKSNNFHFYEYDICSPMFKGLPKVDYIFSMASPASPIDFEKIPLNIMKVNSKGTWNLLELARKNNSKFLQASTSEVYGNPLEHPQKESYFGNVNPIGSRACYDESKRFSEALTINYNRIYSLDTKIVRIFNTYGPGMRLNDGRVIPNFINQALRGEDISIYGDGKQTRSFCYISDLIDAIDKIMFSNVNFPVNCGNPEEKNIKEVADIIIRETNSTSKIKYLPLPEDDPTCRKPDISLLQSISEFSPKVDFNQGIKNTIEYFRNLL